MRRIFETGLERLGRIIASQHNIKVVFQGTRCETDGKTIWLPSCADLSEELMTEMHGYLDHEVAHCLYTDFRQLEKLEEKGRSLHQKLLNAVEDSRIEREIVKVYPGCGLNLDVINNKFKDDNDLMIKSKVCPVCMQEVQSRLSSKQMGLHPDIKAILRPWGSKTCEFHEELKPVLPWPVRLIMAIRDVMDHRDPCLDEETQPYFDLVSDDADRLNDCEDTESLRVLTGEMVKKIVEALPEEEKEDKSGESESGESESGESESGERSLGDRMAASDGSDEESEDAWRQAETSIDERMARQVQDEASDSDQVNPDIAHVADGRSLHVPFSTAWDTETDLSGKGDTAAYRGLLRDVSHVVNPIRRELEKVLLVQENRRWVRDRERGSIDTSNLARLATDRNFRRPFKSATRTETNNVAVEMLVDMSGSMRGRKMLTAKAAVIAMAEALTALKIPFEVTGWHTTHCGDLRRASRGQENGFNRTQERQDYYIYKNFASKQLNGIEKLFVGHNNCDPEAVAWAADRLSQRREKRRILIVFSDGFPAAISDVEIMQVALKANVKKISKSEMEVVGIGILSDSVKHFYPDHVVINRISDLPGSAMGKLAKIITRNAK